MQKLLFSFTLLLFLFSCSRLGDFTAPLPVIENVEAKVDTTPVIANKIKSSPDFNVALKFINEYTALCNSDFKEKSQTYEANWIRKHALLTDNFKNSYSDLINSALKKEPVLGLGFDPILNAQDFPEQGFVIVNSDNETGFVTVKGKDWPEFVLVLKVINQNGKSLVDGSGVINIQANKRAER